MGWAPGPPYLLVKRIRPLIRSVVAVALDAPAGAMASCPGSRALPRSAREPFEVARADRAAQRPDADSAPAGTASLTPRGHRTRSKLLVAAREIFSRTGFFEVRITDITARAGVASGTFYTYFDSKEELFREVAA